MTTAPRVQNEIQHAISRTRACLRRRRRIGPVAAIVGRVEKMKRTVAFLFIMAALIASSTFAQTTPTTGPALAVEGDGSPGSTVKATISGANPGAFALLAVGLGEGETQLGTFATLSVAFPRLLIMGQVDDTGTQSTSMRLPRGLPEALNGTTVFFQGIVIAFTMPTTEKPVPEIQVEVTGVESIELVVPPKPTPEELQKQLQQKLEELRKRQREALQQQKQQQKQEQQQQQP
jgi:hypothetical protein